MAFPKRLLKILDKQAPLKTKILRHNINSYVSKKLRKKYASIKTKK